MYINVNHYYHFHCTKITILDIQYLYNFWSDRAVKQFVILLNMGQYQDRRVGGATEAVALGAAIQRVPPRVKNLKNNIYFMRF